MDSWHCRKYSSNKLTECIVVIDCSKDSCRIHFSETFAAGRDKITVHFSRTLESLAQFVSRFR